MAEQRQYGAIGDNAQRARTPGIWVNEAAEHEGEPASCDRLVLLFLMLARPSGFPLLEFIAERDRSFSECADWVGPCCADIRSQLAELENLGFIRNDCGRYMLADQRVAEFIRLAQTFAANNAEALMRCEHVDRTALWAREEQCGRRNRICSARYPGQVAGC